MRPFGFSVELAYAALVVLICVVIYVMTRELYSLSGHKGIRFFRNAFLFFALAYVFRFVPLLFRLAELRMPGHRIGFLVGTYLFGYASSMAIISLARSVTWKRLEKGLLSRPWVYHFIALVLPLSVLLERSLQAFFLTQWLLIMAAFFITHRYHARRPRKHSMYYTYMFLLLFWMMNVAIASIPRFMTTAIYALYAFSTALFIVILYKVVWRIRR